MNNILYPFLMQKLQLRSFCWLTEHLIFILTYAITEGSWNKKALRIDHYYTFFILSTGYYTQDIQDTICFGNTQRLDIITMPYSWGWIIIPLVDLYTLHIIHRTNGLIDGFIHFECLVYSVPRSPAMLTFLLMYVYGQRLHKRHDNMLFRAILLVVRYT